MTTPLTYKPRQPRKFNLLQPIFQLPGIVKLITKRQRHYLGLTLLALIDVILAVGLVTNASFFSQAVDRVVLLQELKAFSDQTGRPPFSTSIYVFPSQRKPLTLEAAERLSSHIADTISSEVGLPVKRLVPQVASGNLMLKPSPGSTLFSQGKDYLGDVEAVYLPGVSDQMKIVEGSPLDEKGASKDTLDVWMYDSMAQSMGIHIGEKMSMGVNLGSAQVPIHVVGVWKAKDPKSDFWFSNPDSSLNESFLVRRSDYIKFVQPIIDSGSGEASWYVVLDQNKLIPTDSPRYLKGFTRSLDIINKYLPGSRMNTPPLDPLTKFVQRSGALTVLMLGYNLPALAILLYFLALTAGIIAQWQRRETVMLVGRGMSIGGVLTLTIVEQMILFVIGYPLGILFGMLIAWAMGFTSSFLSFISRPPLPVSLEGLSLPLTILALAFALFARLWPTLRAARSSLVMEERERARPVNKPFWFRFYLDIFLLLPTWYAYDQMSKRGSLAGLIISKPEDLYRDPLLIVVPALFILTVSLVTMRLFALLMRLVDLIAGYIPWLTIHLALRQLGRQSLDYIQPLLLVLVSLSMGVYTLSMAASLDQWTVDRMYYRAGSDFAFTPISGIGVSDPATMVDGSWIPLPADFQTVPGVEKATRVGDFTGVVHAGTDSASQARVRFMAIDRAEFPAVAWFRRDFANESLGAMMNRLALSDDAILVPQSYLKDNNFSIGDTISMDVASVSSEFTIVGTYNYFPTAYDDPITVIGNLDYISTLSGMTAPHDIWLKLKPGTDTKQLIKDIGVLGISVSPLRYIDPHQLILDEQGRMERVGIFGTLSVGFLATAVMAILGLLIYSYASLQERAYRLAVLNAVGLSRNQIMAQVILEYTFLTLFGVIAGALIGLTASQLFVPFFRYTGEKGVPLPPLLPIIASGQLRNLSAIFGLTIVGVEVLTIASLLHNRLVQILKRVWM